MYANTAEAQKVVDRMQAYGVQATGEVVCGDYHDGVSYDNRMGLAELAAAGGRVTRVRVLASRDWGYATGDISYIHGTLPDGTVVPLYLGGGVYTGHMYGPKGLKARMIDWAKEEKVFAKGLGLLDESNWSVLWG